MLVAFGLLCLRNRMFSLALVHCSQRVVSDSSPQVRHGTLIFIADFLRSIDESVGEVEGFIWGEVVGVSVKEGCYVLPVAVA